MRSIVSLSLAAMILLLALMLAVPSATPRAAAPSSAAPGQASQQYLYFSGHVYDQWGYGIEAQDMVTIWGYNTTNGQWELLDRVNTGREGEYSLRIEAEVFIYSKLQIRESNYPGYISLYATSIGGYVVGPDTIEYSSGWANKVRTDNDFWDLWPEPTPTWTATPTRTMVPTPTRTNVPTPTRTNVPTPTRTNVPTPTRTNVPTPTSTLPARPTATPTHTPIAGDVGWLQGTVFDAASTSPYAVPCTMATVQISPGLDVTADPVTGQYGPVALAPNLYTLTVSAPGYGVEYAPVTIVAGATIVQDFALWRPVVQVWPAGLTAYAITSTVGLITMTNMSHGGPPYLDYQVASVPSWAQTSPVSGTVAAPGGQLIEITFVCPGAGTFQGTLSFTHSDPCQGPVDVPLTLTCETPTEQPLVVTKTLLDPPGGVANVGDVVRFQIQVRNPSAQPVSDFSLEDTFTGADFEFVTAVPGMGMAYLPTTDEYRLIRCQESLAPGQVHTYEVQLRTKQPAAAARNCVDVNVPGPWAGHACASVQVRLQDGKHFSAYKEYFVPSNHIASVGDTVSWLSRLTNTGTVTMTQLAGQDQQTPGCGTKSWGVTYLSPLAPGQWQGFGMTSVLTATCSPLVNTVDWTVDWPDGTHETKTVSDYLFVVDGPVGEGLVLTKQLVSPLGGAAISDTVTFRLKLTKTTGVGATAAVTDTYDAACLSFQSGSIAPDHAAPGFLNWSSVGQLPAGATWTVDVHFHADAACPAAINCAFARLAAPGGIVAAACDKVAILGSWASLSVVKTLQTGNPARPGDTVGWHIRVQNTGSADASVVPLQDTYPSAFFDFLSASPPPTHQDLASGQLDWANLGPLAPGQVHTVIVRLTAKKVGLAQRNCAETSYTAGSSAYAPQACATVDILTTDAAIGVQKVLAQPLVAGLLAVGDTAAFSVTLRNLGAVTLTNVVADDLFSTACLDFEESPDIGASFPAPGQLSWTLPALGIGEERSWTVVLRGTADCTATENCVTARADSPIGPPVEDTSCVQLDVAAADPRLSIRKRMVAPAALPRVGDILTFELVVVNTGNSTFDYGPLEDAFDPDCLEFVAASPPPDFVDPPHGIVLWDQAGPLAPGQSFVGVVDLRAKAICLPSQNCGRIWMVDVNGTRVEERDCHDVYTAITILRLYLPILLRD
jgi:uncharacterized repeat protein (TIGR01451 family)